MRVLFFLLMLVVLAPLVPLALADEIRVLSYNIHHGVGLDGKLDLKRIAEVIRKEKPDFVALQEVDNMAGRSGKVDQAAVLAKMLGMHHAFGKCIDLQGGGYGNAVLSIHPISNTVIHRLPGSGEPRVVLEVETKIDGKKLSFASVHFDWRTEKVRMMQAKAVEKNFTAHKHPVILLGDFNAKPDSKTMRFLAKNWTIVPKAGAKLTAPANKPHSEIDYILTLGLDASKAICKVIDEPVASDHRPISGAILIK